jgi:hypothetical protein
LCSESGSVGVDDNLAYGLSAAEFDRFDDQQQRAGDQIRA